MKIKGNKIYFFALTMMVTGCNNPRQHNTDKDPDAVRKYELVKGWPQLPVGYIMGNPTGIGIDSNQNVFIFHRAGREWPFIGPMPQSVLPQKTILELNTETGKIINSWGDGLFIMPHGLTVDWNNNIWVTDVGLHQVFKFSHDGKLLMKLGEAGIAGTDSIHFNLPTDVAVAKDGSFYVSDGYGNSRIIKFSASGRYLCQWGKYGNGPGEFNIPHSIDIDDNGNVYVADRENSRIQIFNADGKFLKEWKDNGFGKIYAVALDRTNKESIAVDYLINSLMIPKGSDIVVFDSTGKIISKAGRSGLYNGPVCRYHDIAIDKKGNIYAEDILGNSIQKFKIISR